MFLDLVRCGYSEFYTQKQILDNFALVLGVSNPDFRVNQPTEHRKLHQKLLLQPDFEISETCP